MNKSLILVLIIQYFSNGFTKSIDNVDEDAYGEVTYPRIGHFTTNDFKDPTIRPIVFLPQSPEHIKPRFLLYTRKNPKDEQHINYDDHESIKKSNFDGTKQTKFIVHGFLDSPIIGPYMMDFKDEFLAVGDYNVIIVDWSGGNGLPYGQATANTRVVGPVIALLILDLKNSTGLQLQDVHLLGHSLGSHVVGYAGEYLKGQIGRITGLDPAGPYFEGLPPAARLDPTDALYVDAIHTDARHLIPDLGFGCYETSGHLDFYPNGGRSQPGCDTQRWTSILIDGLVEGARRLVACNHQRAVDFYQSSLRQKQRGVAYQCSDYESFKNGKCTDCGPNGDKCAFIGDRAVEWKKFENTTKGTRFFMSTADKYPFFKYEYEIQVKFQKENEHNIASHGNLMIKLQSQVAEEEITLNKNDQIFHLGQTYTFITNFDYDFGDIKSLTFRWTRSLGMIVKEHMWVDSITVVPLSSANIQNRELHTKEIKTFCAANRSDGIPNEHDVEFTTNCK